MMINNIWKNYLSSNVGFYLLSITAVLDLIIPFVLAPFCNGYRSTTMVMSLLGNGKYPLHKIYNSWLVLAGILFLLGTIKLRQIYMPISPSLTRCLTGIIVIYAVGACILSGFFQVGETKELITTAEKIHGYGSSLGFLLLTFAPMLLGILSIRSRQNTIGIVSFLFFVLALFFFILFIMSDKEQFAETIIAKEGLWQRASLLCMYAPIIMVSLQKMIKMK